MDQYSDFSFSQPEYDDIDFIRRIQELPESIIENISLYVGEVIDDFEDMDVDVIDEDDYHFFLSDNNLCVPISCVDSKYFGDSPLKNLDNFLNMYCEVQGKESISMNENSNIWSNLPLQLDWCPDNAGEAGSVSDSEISFPNVSVYTDIDDALYLHNYIRENPDFIKKFCSIRDSFFMGSKGPILNDQILHKNHFYLYGPGVRLEAPIIHVVLHDFYIVTLRAVDIDELESVLLYLCEICMHPFNDCCCECFKIRRNGSWKITNERGHTLHIDRPLFTYNKNFRYLNAYWRRSRSLLEILNDTSSSDEVQGFETILTPTGDFALFSKLFEDITTLIYFIRNSETVEDVCMAISAFARSVTGTSCLILSASLMLYCKEVISEYFMVQNDSWIERMDNLWENYSHVKNSPFAKKFMNLMNTTIAQVIFHKIGIQPDENRFKSFQKKHLIDKFRDFDSVFECLGNLVVFILKQGRQFILTGDTNVFFMDYDTVGNWYTRARRLKADFEFLCNPEVVDIDIHKYLEDLSTAIKEGNCLSKNLDRHSPEWKLAISMSIELESLEKKYLTLMASLTSRKQPLGIVIYGNPGIGKSSILNMIRVFYAKRFSKDPREIFTHYHNSEDEFFPGFKTFQWCMVMDDIAQHKPARVQDIDPSIAFTIKIVNNIPWSPPQAAIEDKGKTPIMVDLCLATTNVLDMNIHHYFSSSYAVMRRLPIHIEPIVKEQYCVPGTKKLDPERACSEDSFENYWDFIIREPVCGENQHGMYRITHKFKSMRELLEFLGPIMDKHDRNQRSLIQKCSKYENIVLCENCNMPKSMCACDCLPVIDNDCTQGAVQSLPRPNCDFEEEFKDEDIEYVFNNDPETIREDDIFLFQAPLSETPWRIANGYDPLTHGRPRYYDEIIAKRFIISACREKKHDERIKEYACEYACYHLSGLMERGVSNNYIKKDFDMFLGYKYKLEHVDDQKKAFFSMLGVNEETSWWRRRLSVAFIYLYFEYTFIRTLILFFCRFSIFKTIIFAIFGGIFRGHNIRREYMSRAGAYIDNKLKGSSTLVKLIAIFSAVHIANSLWRNFQRARKTPDKEKVFLTTNTLRKDADRNLSKIDKQRHNLDDEEKLYISRKELADKVDADVQRYIEEFNAKYFPKKNDQELQGALADFGRMPEPAVGDDKVNVWIQPERSVTSLDFISSRATNIEALGKSLKRGCVIIDIISNKFDHQVLYTGRAIILSNEAILINAHAVPKSAFCCSVYYNEKRSGVVAKTDFFVDPNQVTLYTKRDLAIVRTKSLPMLFGGNLFKNFAKDSFDGIYDGYYMLRQQDGSFKKNNVYRIVRTLVDKVIGDNDFSTVAFEGTPEYPTVQGDCGAPLIMDTGFGPIVVGIHFIYNSEINKVYATRVTFQDVQPYCSGFQVQCGVLENYYDINNNTKTFVDYHETGAIMYHGNLNIPRTRAKSRVSKSEIADQLYLMDSHEDFKFEDKFSEPFMHSWIPQQIALKEYITPANGLNEIKLALCAEVLFKDIINHLPESELKLIHTYPLNVAVNGMPGMAYVDAIKKSTSMGFPYLTTKRKFLEPMDSDIWQDGVKFTKEIEDAVEALLDKYEKGVRGHPIFSANLKDEVVTRAKFIKQKTRVFFSCPYDFLIVVRMAFLGFTRVVQRNWKIFHCVVGVNVHCDQWEQLYTIMMKYGDNKFIAGDFAGFDKKFSQSFMRWAFWVIKKICEKSGNFSEKEMLVIECIEADLTNPSVNWFGMLVTLLSGETSGHQTTTIFNCFLCVLYNMYCYSLIYDINDYFNNVVIFSLGDDHIVSVSDSKPNFTHTYIKEVLDNVGVGYTMAQKEEESEPYISINRVTFLKRKFVYHEHLGAICAPLEKDSIMKMLTYSVESKVCSKAESLAQAICSASMEAFYHGKDFFSYINFCIDEVEKSASLLIHMKQYPRFTWDENIERFWKASKRPKSQAKKPCLNQKDQMSYSYCTKSNLTLQGSVRMDNSFYVTRAFPEVRIYGKVRLHPKKVSKVWRVELSSLLENKRLAETNNNMMGSTSNQMSNEELNEQAPPSMDDLTPQDDQQEVTSFIHEMQDEPLNLSTIHDPTADMQLIQSGLKQFLSRPAKIGGYDWTLGAPDGIVSTFYPWNAYFMVPAIRRKLENFGLLRCNLHVKMIINASPFYYGAIAAIYCPRFVDVQDKTGAWANYAPGQQVLLSQRNKVWLNPQSVTTAEIVLPFLHWDNFIDLRQQENVYEMGKIDLVQFAELASANGVVAGAVSINFYAWATEVELAGATTHPILQGKKSEYSHNGMISGPASTVNSISRKLKTIPVLGPLATATEVVSGAIGDVASFFGFTNVPVVDDVKPFKPNAFHTLASSQISEPINKLSLQPKQETSVGMYFGDNQQDPLVISNFVARESFLCGALWTTVIPEDSVLFTSTVTPDLFEYSTSPVSSWYPTPMAYISSFFQYWRGDIIFRIKVIKSKYHKGRLNIAWDMGIDDAADMPISGDPSVFNVVMDLETEDEVEIRVPYTQAFPFLETTYLNFGQFWSNGGTPTFTGYGNGTLQVRVLNILTAPISSSDVNVLIFVRGADNLEFSAPRNMKRDKTLLEIQGKVIELNQVAPLPSDAYKENFGERILSMRELLHRQSKCVTQVIPKLLDWNGNVMTAVFPFQRIPRIYGYSDAGWERAVGLITPANNYPFNYVRNHPMVWMIACFIGFKGSTNYTFNVTNQNSNVNNATGYISFSRKDLNQSFIPRTFANANSNTSNVTMRNINTNLSQDSQGAAGMALTNQYTQAGLSVNLPYYLQRKFLISDLQMPYLNQADTGWEKDAWELTVKRAIGTANTTDTFYLIDVMCGTGPDFDVIYFLNCPAIFNLPPPTAAEP